MRFFLLLLLVVPSTACVVRELPPPAPPPPTIPAVAESVPDEPGPGWGRLMISTDVPASVSYRDYRSPSRVLCSRTPCVVTLPFGEHLLSFHGTRDTGRTGEARVTLRAPTVVLNHTLGQSRLGAGQTLGFLTVVAGAIALSVGLVVLGDPKQRGMDHAGGQLVAGGAGGILLGGLLMGVMPSMSQPGASREWTPGQAQAAGASMGWKF